MTTAASQLPVGESKVVATTAASAAPGKTGALQRMKRSWSCLSTAVLSLLRALLLLLPRVAPPRQQSLRAAPTCPAHASQFIITIIVMYIVMDTSTCIDESTVSHRWTSMRGGRGVWVLATTSTALHVGRDDSPDRERSCAGSAAAPAFCQQQTALRLPALCRSRAQP